MEGGDRAELVRRTIAAGQGWAPGSRFRYATFTFDLLAEAIERALGPAVRGGAARDGPGPAGHGRHDLRPTRVRRAAGAGRRRRLGRDAPRADASAGADAEGMVAAYASLRLAGGGLWSTASDLLRFGRAMLRGGELDGVRVLGRPIVDLMTREVTVDGLGGDRPTG